MNFEDWLKRLAVELAFLFGTDGAEYIRQTGKESWRPMFDDGYSPAEAAHEEATALVD